MSLQVIDHPLAKHMLTTLRDVSTEPMIFRRNAKILSGILTLEATRKVYTTETSVQTPIEKTEAPILGQSLAVVPILRAGLAMLEAVVELFPDVAVGYIGMERKEETGISQSYYCKLPSLKEKYTLCFDPMLATGGSAVEALNILKKHGAKQLMMVSVIAAPEGVEKVAHYHPDVPIIVAGVDRGLNEKRFIVPGLGDFGDRLYGTM